MTDLAVAFGLVLVLEGLLWAVVPDAARRTLEAVAAMAPETVKLLGTAAVAAGVCVVWIARG